MDSDFYDEHSDKQYAMNTTIPYYCACALCFISVYLFKTLSSTALIARPRTSDFKGTASCHRRQDVEISAVRNFDFQTVGSVVA